MGLGRKRKIFADDSDAEDDAVAAAVSVAGKSARTHVCVLVLNIFRFVPADFEKGVEYCHAIQVLPVIMFNPIKLKERLTVFSNCLDNIPAKQREEALRSERRVELLAMCSFRSAPRCLYSALLMQADAANMLYVHSESTNVAKRGFIAPRNDEVLL